MKVKDFAATRPLQSECGISVDEQVIFLQVKDAELYGSGSKSVVIFTLRFGIFMGGASNVINRNTNEK